MSLVDVDLVMEDGKCILIIMEVGLTKPLSQWLFRISFIRTSERNVTSRSLIAFTVRS